MKLSIKKEYFDLIKSGIKTSDFRDAHITFICEETGETLIKEVLAVDVIKRAKSFYPDVLNDDNMIVFILD